MFLLQELSTQLKHLLVALLSDPFFLLLLYPFRTPPVLAKQRQKEKVNRATK